MTRVSCIALSLICLGAPLCVWAQELPPAQTQGLSALLRDLSVPDMENIAKAQQAILDYRNQLIAGLQEIIVKQGNQRSDSVRAAMQLLGAFRSVEAIPVLVEHVGYPMSVRSLVVTSQSDLGFSRADPLRAFTAARALVDIGEPCIPAIMERLAARDEVCDRYACLLVLVHLKTTQEVEAMLHLAADSEKDPRRQGRFNTCVALIAKLPQEMP